MRRLRRTFIAICALIFSCSALAAKEQIVISSARELARLSNVEAGTEIVWRNGVYADQVITIALSGTEKAPIVLRAETDGGVRFTGSSHLRIKGSHIVVRGFYWDNPSNEKGLLISFDRVSSHSLLEECTITGNKSDVRHEHVKWVSIWGFKNRVEHCAFLDKRDFGQILIVRLGKDEAAPQHIIRNCHFSRPHAVLNERGGRINGQETIRIGTSDVALQRAECVVENCYFEQCNGEGEIISNKSCGNIYRNNLFYKSRGSLSLRHGNDAQVVGNYFIGNNESGSAGVRVIGEGHIIKGNYFRDLTFCNDRCHFCAIHLMQGHENPAPGGYQQVKSTTVSENIIVNCSYGISACAQSKGCPMPVIDTKVERNTIVVMGGFGSVVSENAPHEIEWRDNIIYGGHQIGLRLAETQKRPKLPKVDDAIKAISNNAGVTSAKSR